MKIPIPTETPLSVQEEITFDSASDGLMNSTKLKTRLINWFDENKETQHYELVNKNEHTDTYLNSNQ